MDAGLYKESNVSPLNLLMLMKNLIISALISSILFLTTTSCHELSQEIAPSIQKKGAREIDLNEVTVTAN